MTKILMMVNTNQKYQQGHVFDVVLQSNYNALLNVSCADYFIIINNNALCCISK